MFTNLTLICTFGTWLNLSRNASSLIGWKINYKEFLAATAPLSKNWECTCNLCTPLPPGLYSQGYLYNKAVTDSANIRPRVFTEIYILTFWLVFWGYFGPLNIQLKVIFYKFMIINLCTAYKLTTEYGIDYRKKF